MTVTALRGTEHWLRQYRNTWRGTIISTLVTPPLYLAALGLGLGAFVGRNAAVTGGVEYLAFVGSGLLAATTLQTAAVEATHPVMAALRWHKQYRAMVHTPLSTTDVLVGHLAFMLLRIAVSSVVFFGYLALFGVVREPGALWAVPAALLLGLACLTPTAAFSAWAERDASLTVFMRFGVTPMVLFGGVFFALDRAPLVVRVVAEVTPLWHGVELCRDILLGRAQAGGVVLHVAVLLLWAVAGFLVARHVFGTRLAS